MKHSAPPPAEDKSHADPSARQPMPGAPGVQDVRPKSADASAIDYTKNPSPDQPDALAGKTKDDARDAVTRHFKGFRGERDTLTDGKSWGESADVKDVTLLGAVLDSDERHAVDTLRNDQRVLLGFRKLVQRTLDMIVRDGQAGPSATNELPKLPG